MNSIKEEARQLVRSMFSLRQFKVYEKKFSVEFRKYIKNVPYPLNEKPYEQFLVAFAFFDIFSLDKSLEELIKVLFPEGEGSVIKISSFCEVYDKYATQQPLFEVRYDNDGFPNVYRPHTDGSFARKDLEGNLHVLEKGVEKGDFIGYEEIASWLKKNR